MGLKSFVLVIEIWSNRGNMVLWERAREGIWRLCTIVQDFWFFLYFIGYWYLGVAYQLIPRYLLQCAKLQITSCDLTNALWIFRSRFTKADHLR
jgi:hypothetical protein